jgi:uncharacterized protein YkwD
VRLIHQARLLACACALLLPACSGGPTAPSDVGNPAPPASSSPAPAPPTLSATLSAIVDLTNQERAANGLPALRAETRLTRAAQIQADQMVRHNRMDHVLAEAQYPRPEDRLAAAAYNWQTYGENLAVGYVDARAVVTGWMESPGHRANILGTSFTEIGVGLTRDGNGRPYYAQMFGRPR